MSVRDSTGTKRSHPILMKLHDQSGVKAQVAFERRRQNGRRLGSFQALIEPQLTLVHICVVSEPAMHTANVDTAL